MQTTRTSEPPAPCPFSSQTSLPTRRFFRSIHRLSVCSRRSGPSPHVPTSGSPKCPGRPLPFARVPRLYFQRWRASNPGHCFPRRGEEGDTTLQQGPPLQPRPASGWLRWSAARAAGAWRGTAAGGRPAEGFWVKRRLRAPAAYLSWLGRSGPAWGVAWLGCPRRRSWCPAGGS